MKLKLITAAIIFINVLLLFQEIPTNVIGLTLISLATSFFVHGKKLRSFFKFSLLIGTLFLLRHEFKVLLVTECGISLALLLSSLKFWELNEEQDHYNMFLILALCECCVFLLNPMFLIFFFGLIKMFFYFYYILKIRNYDVSLLNPKRLLILIAPAIVLSFLLFYTFPRFTQGFINSNDLQYIISGGTSKIDFRQLGPLTPSNDVAFKVVGLENSRLPIKALYWKSSVLWQLAGQEWRTSNNNLKQNAPEQLPTARYHYSIEVFQNVKDFLPTLDGLTSITSTSQAYNSYEDGTFRLKYISRDAVHYSVSGNYGDRKQSITNLMKMKGLKLKIKNAQEIKKAYFSEALNSSNDEERLKALLKVFTDKSFEYSTTPPLYNSIEDFLLSGKNGYCSHFAAAFTFLARLYNLPSRMVVGYLGGELNPYDNSILVKELDAHAWVEIYLQNKGWVKVDPTALVVPERLSMSAEDFNNKLNPYISIFNFQINRELLNFSTLKDASLWMDSINSKFYGSVFNFDREKQLAIIRTLTPKNFSAGWIFVITLSVFLLIFWTIFHYYGKAKLHPAERRYQRFQKRMNSQGLRKADHETISHFRLRCLATIPNEANYIDSEIGHYIDSFYK